MIAVSDSDTGTFFKKRKGRAAKRFFENVARHALLMLKSSSE
jgi:hypothetical protein